MKLTAFIEGIGLGMVASYLPDPERGTRRRAQIRDKVIQQGARKREAVHIMLRDFANRSQGMRSRVQQRFNNSQVPDDVLLERVRAELGRHVSHFHALTVTCEEGTIKLEGPILASEIQDCVWHARMVPGVKHVANGLIAHASKENIPELQGGIQALASARWTPATSLVMGVAGVLLTAYGIGKKGLTGTAMQLTGFGMIAKAFHDTEHRFDPKRRNVIAMNVRDDDNRIPAPERAATTS